MKCLLCERETQQTIKFHELFLFKNPQNFICSLCEQSFEKISDKHCPRCYKSGSDEICKDCILWEKQGKIIQHHAIFQYNTAMKEFFSQYKFMGDYRLHQVFQAYFKYLKKYGTIVPIPLSEKGYQLRGFNQVSAFLADLPSEELLLKKESVAQSSLSRQERLTSKNVFSLKENIKIPKKVILVDDIYTTGATLQHAIEVLCDAGVEDIKTFSLCR
ncbi:ComF family protein [Lactococcus nasutitermitis]|uniref:ComF family protein n=1 Tax=Lactococcus nasutitermitis TaxID=1652957 RepID=A0ABV9JEQ3_9LACT|nr:ComF family protein [Lactococcus nasutitermitis]